MILEAVEALTGLFGQGVGTQVVDLIQEHTSPASPGYPPWLPVWIGSETRPKLDKSIQEEEEKVRKARLAVAKAEDGLSVLRRGVEGLVNQIDAHHREDDARRERSHSGNDGMEGVFVEEVGG